MRRNHWFALIAAVATVAFALPAMADGLTRLVTQEEALEETFGADLKNMEVKRAMKVLQGDALQEVAEALGGSLHLGGDAPEQGARQILRFHEVWQGDKLIAVVLIDREPGRWGPIEVMVAINGPDAPPQNGEEVKEGTVKRAIVMGYSERRGRPIARRSFLNQFDGKSAEDPFVIRRDIVGISGATISARSAAFGVQKAAVLYKHLYQAQEDNQD